MTKQLKEKYEDLKKYLQGFDSLAVAFSGRKRYVIPQFNIQSFVSGTWSNVGCIEKK